MYQPAGGDGLKVPAIVWLLRDRCGVFDPNPLAKAVIRSGCRSPGDRSDAR